MEPVPYPVSSSECSSQSSAENIIPLENTTLTNNPEVVISNDSSIDNKSHSDHNSSILNKSHSDHNLSNKKKIDLRYKPYSPSSN